MSATDPGHYGSDGRPPPTRRDPPVQLIEVLEGLEWNQASDIKYLYRYKDKGGLRDLAKARWHLDRLVVKAQYEESEARND